MITEEELIEKFEKFFYDNDIDIFELNQRRINNTKKYLKKEEDLINDIR